MATPERLRIRARTHEKLLLALLVLAAVPAGLGAWRKVRTFGQADIVASREAGGYRIEAVGRSALVTGLRAGDLVIAAGDRPALEGPAPSRLLASRGERLVVRRDGALLPIDAPAVPRPWDAKYLFLLVVAGLFAASGARALVAGVAGPEASLFAAFAIAVALVLSLTPAPPYDAFFRLTVVLEDVARAVFPALLLELVFTFPRRSRRVFRVVSLLPAFLLLGETARVYLGFASAGAAVDAIERLDTLQGAWMAFAAIGAAARILWLSARKTDLLTERQLRWLLLGTAVGLLPVCFLDLLPRATFGALPFVSALSVLPLALLPIAFLAALTRWRLWDADVLGRETASLVGAALAGAALLAGTEALLAHPLPRELPHARELLLSASGLFVALSFVPMRRGLSAAFSRLQYGEAWRERQTLQGLVRELAIPRRPAEIEALLAERIGGVLRIPRTVLLPVSGETLDAGSIGGRAEAPLTDLPPEALARPVRLSRTEFSALPTETVARLRAAGLRTLFPLAAGGRLLAFLAVGDREGRIPLSADDRALLETVLAPAALALSHARLWEEVRAHEKASADRDRLQALGALSAGVAHEVNTPLAGVAGFARLLLDETPADDPRRPLVEKIERQAFRASRLVGALLDMARGRPRDLAALDAATLAREARRSLEDDIPHGRVDVDVRLGDGSGPRVRGHADALVQVLVNLLRNAIEACAAVASPDAPGRVVLSLRRDGDAALFEVLDDGPGLSPEAREKAFEPFFSTKKAQGGTGLGLAIARDIIAAHGGTIVAEPAPGRGSRFLVRLPAL